ncbi:unnamed protein product (mitochondrion) [Plasmodiophora brassicae]|uniref:Pirin N-terminal domain-containing protein n=1 Tax=Plasmodiophora brassicae TaxID=37360 RepID=A0A3P3Y336_PLABS|nr:unnamed protein product [Plasmodiophora brassicae]
MGSGAVLSVADLDVSAPPFQTYDPFLFCVYHRDEYPAGDGSMQAPRRGNGNDFDRDAPYRMYHGDRIPGFPQHPHRGFETLTCTIKGIIDHTDSLGCAGRYGNGDLQWMTAGKGIVHGENFPLINTNAPNPTKFFQIWLNLPHKSKLANPDQVMFWAERIPRVSLDAGRVQVTVWAGEFNGVRGLPPPKNSWASDPAHDVAVWLIEIDPGGSVSLPPSAKSSNRTLYFVGGDAIAVDDQRASQHSLFRIRDQTQPINEPVHQYGPFVMNSREEIQQAFADYRATQFGGWPWEQDAVVFPADKGRFVSINGVESRPPSA